MTPDLAIVLLRFGAACAGSLACAWVLAALLRLAAVRWPALAAHRSVWLLAQGAVLLAFVLACAPLPRAALAPALALAPIAADTADADLGSDADASGPATAPIVATQAATPAAPHAARPMVDAAHALRWLPAAWLALYLAGLGWHLARRLRARRRWQALLRDHTRPIDAAGWPALDDAQRRRIGAAGLALRTTDLPVSPMLLGILRPCLLLPAQLAQLPAGQQRLVVEHELTHRRRADPLWLAVSGAIALLFWFNRPCRRLDDLLREAVELGCDDAVLRGRAATERQGYAAALVAQLRLQLQWQAHRQAHRQAHWPADAGAPAFGNLGVAGRVQRMRSATPPRLSGRGRALVGLGALGTAGVATLLQPAFSTAAVAPAAPLSVPPAPTAPEPWRYPLDRVRVTALYGVRSPSVPQGHHGVDFAARRGTPVRAVAAGTVVEAAFNPAWGHYVRVDHGGGASSLLIHLDRAAVAYGRRVAAGDLLGTAGASGRATGPHLHLEYWRDGRRLDPAAMLVDLSAHATPTALARRRAQGHPIPTDL
ncbi:peptidoglycan DD-metalloendopeptidase family protein [uncultured Massilia sp.]|uniref:peptidoglycan DD-metalloendopeptidase family protein n=1 Tax=uncultured Massilia sp. TaxID=169973 RepID=UPI0025D584DB|nr:peptidoglycan DD-metalloendopeptidase family protein [uncultured Massilia sp.]